MKPILVAALYIHVENKDSNIGNCAACLNRPPTSKRWIFIIFNSLRTSYSCYYQYVEIITDKSKSINNTSPSAGINNQALTVSNVQSRVTVTGVENSATATPTIIYHFNHGLLLIITQIIIISDCTYYNGIVDSEVIIISTIVSTAFGIMCCCGLGMIIIVGLKVVHRPNKKNHRRGI